MVKMMKIVLALIFMFSLFFVDSCSSIPPEKQCSVDNDCVPSACCHADSAVSKSFSPDCKDVFCSLDCQPDTIDCGQGSVRCLEKRCTVVLNE